MGKTIIQTIGPLYGEVDNGTVFGRPNGSVYVPASNTIAIVAKGSKIKAFSGFAVSVANAGGSPVQTKVYAESQDLSSHMQLQLSDSSDFATYTVLNGSAGLFNWEPYAVAPISTEITEGTTYYLRAQLITSSGVAVATSSVVELEGAE